MQITHGMPFVIIGVNNDDDISMIRETVKEKNLTWRSFWNGPSDASSSIAERWCISSWPTTFLIDANGVIRYREIYGERLDRAIESLLKEMGESVDLSGIGHK